MNPETCESPSEYTACAHGMTRFGVWCLSSHWANAIGLETTLATVEIRTASLESEVAIPNVVAHTGEDPRRSMDELKAVDVDMVLMLGDGWTSDTQHSELFIVQDHINLSGGNPLIGMNDSGGAPRFVDMNGAYALPYQTHLQEAASRAGCRHLGGIAVDGGPKEALRPGEAGTNGLAQPVIAARHAGLDAAAVLWVNPGQGTFSSDEGLEIEGISRFWGEWTTLLAKCKQDV